MAPAGKGWRGRCIPEGDASILPGMELIVVNSAVDIPQQYRGTPIADLLEYHNLERPQEAYTQRPPPTNMPSPKVLMMAMKKMADFK